LRSNRDTVYVWSLEHEDNPCLGEFLETQEDAVLYLATYYGPVPVYSMAPADCVFIGTASVFKTYLAERRN
jgi:hypothetical protein